MPIINDYCCVQCNWRQENMIENPLTCQVCGSVMRVDFSGWKTVEFDARKDEKTDAKGAIKAFGLLDDPLASAQLGLGDSSLQSFKKIDDNTAQEFKERLLTDGDSPKLRRKVLRAYNEAVGNKYQLEE